MEEKEQPPEGQHSIPCTHRNSSNHPLISPLRRTQFPHYLREEAFFSGGPSPRRMFPSKKAVIFDSSSFLRFWIFPKKQLTIPSELGPFSPICLVHHFVGPSLPSPPFFFNTARFLRISPKKAADHYSSFCCWVAGSWCPPVSTDQPASPQWSSFFRVE
jgi:hypothetical protein